MKSPLKPILGAIVYLTLIACLPSTAAPISVTDSTALPLVSKQELPEIFLRGYGKVSGEQDVFGSGTILKITCENEDKAKLTLAKYLSDLQLLSGVQPVDLKDNINGWEIEGQGDIAAVRSENEVFIIASPKREGVEKLIDDALGGDKEKLVSSAEVPVPMWLDKWDKYGFLMCGNDSLQMFMPPVSDHKTFDFFKPFEWLHNDVKMGYSVDPYWGVLDYSEGVSSEPFFNWQENTLLELGIPFAYRDLVAKIEETPLWFANRYRDSMQQSAPYCVLNFGSRQPDPGWANQSRVLAWSADEDVEDQLLAEVQQMIRRVDQYPNLLNYMAPFGEIQHGEADLLLEWGPVADASYQKYLKAKYDTLETLSQRWYGSEDSLKSWQDVHVPELAEFEGWSPDAIDIGGVWKVKRLAAKEDPPSGWETPDCDESDWEEVRTPGDWMMFGGYKSPGTPAVFRIKFNVTDDWLGKHPKQWLYVWDMSPWNSEVAYSVNGKEIVHDKGWPYDPHWMAIDVTGNVASGSNQLALLLPNGYIGYRVYLSGQEPKKYPFLGSGANARWVDFMDWHTACRITGIRRGMDTVRQVDPDKPILIVAPHLLEDEGREAAIDLGGTFHDSGGMTGSWNIKETMLTDAAGLPYSLEGGVGARTVDEYKAFFGRWITEGVQAVENVGPAMITMYYKDDLRKCVEDYMPMARMIGKYHTPPAKVAYFCSDRETEMVRFPWKPDQSKVLTMGYFGWYCALEYPTVGVMESDFLKDRVEKYSVVIDTNTQIMDEKVVDGIERYVRNGGVFVTLGQTGRHTETEADAWPISRLTGYKVVAIDPHAPEGSATSHPGGLADPLSDNGIFRVKSWSENMAYADDLNHANGLSLQKVAPECRDLIEWNDGTTAVGIRPLGKGYIIDMGVIFGRDGGSFVMKKLLEDIVLWKGNIERTPAQIYPAVVADPASLPADLHIPGTVYLQPATALQTSNDHDYDGFPWSYKNVFFRHYQSNNGLYDIWVLFNDSPADSRTVDLTFRDGLNPAFAVEVKTNQEVVINQDGGIPKIKDIELEPLETKMFLTPRKDHIQQAGLDWFGLQRNWWRSSYVPGPPLPPDPHKFTVDLYDNWSFMPLDGKSDEEIQALANPSTDDKGWERRPLGIWTTPNRQNVRHGLLRRWVDIPKNWDKGAVRFWLTAWYSKSFFDHGSVYIDGQKQLDQDAFLGIDMTDILKPGSRHLVAIEVQSDGQLTGVRGDCWLYYTPQPVATTSLAGDWTSSSDMIHYDNKVTLPGSITGQTVRRTDVTLDRSQKGRNVVLYVDSDNRIHGALVNGHWAARHHHCIGTFLELNITPWVNFDAPNEIELTGFSNNNANAQTRTMEIRYYNPGEYP